MSRVSRTGQPAPSWTPAPELSALANDCFRACVNEHAKPDLIRVYRNNAQTCYGRCFIEQRIITIGRDVCDPRRTLAHEIAHLRVRAHGVRHKELTDNLYEWILKNAGLKQAKHGQDSQVVGLKVTAQV